MTMPEAKSIEEQLIKISLRTLVAILLGVIVGVGTAVSMYSNLVLTQERILNEITKTRSEFENRIQKVEGKIETIQGQMKGGQP